MRAASLGESGAGPRRPVPGAQEPVGSQREGETNCHHGNRFELDFKFPVTVPKPRYLSGCLRLSPECPRLRTGPGPAARQVPTPQAGAEAWGSCTRAGGHAPGRGGARIRTGSTGLGRWTLTRRCCVWGEGTTAVPGGGGTARGQRVPRAQAAGSPDFSAGQMGKEAGSGGWWVMTAPPVCSLVVGIWVLLRRRGPWKKLSRSDQI